MPAVPVPTATTLDLTAIRQQIMTNTSILYSKRPNAVIIVTGKTLLTAHILGSPQTPADILVSGSPHSEVGEAYISLLRETAFRLNDFIARAQKAKAAEKKS